jgi:hypothetical protein
MNKSFSLKKREKEIAVQPLSHSKTENVRIPLTFNILTDYSIVKNIILIDNQVKNYKSFFDNTNNVSFPIIYDFSSGYDELLTIFKKFTNIDKIAFVFDEMYLWAKSKRFINNEPFYNESDLNTNDINKLSANMKLLVNSCIELNVKNVDFLACNSLKYNNWTKYYSQLNLLTKTDSCPNGVIIGASNNSTGNIKYGGDWILESTGQNIEMTYFNNGLNEYAYTLVATTIHANSQIIFQNNNINSNIIEYNVDSSVWVTVDSWPVTIINDDLSDNLRVLLYNLNINPDIVGSTSGTDVYFIAGSDKIIFGNNIDTPSLNITINGITNYPGLIQNGVLISDIDNIIVACNKNIIVQNIKMDCSGSTLSTYNGWICQEYFGFGSLNTNITPYTPSCLVRTCTSNGDVTNDKCGGIIGTYSTTKVNKCSSSGNFSAYFVGGILGNQSYFCTITNCYSIGNFSSTSDNTSGGILFEANNCMITNCYSTGDFTSDSNNYLGGICSYANNCTITNCYSTGNFTCVSNNNSGGILRDCYNCTITNCYSTGNFISNNNQAGGICEYINNCTITNCYSSGNFISNNNNEAGGICVYIDNSTATNCYSVGNFTSNDNNSTNNSGGIFGPYANNSTATNCYSMGNFTCNGDNSTNNSGGIIGPFSYNSIATNCYSTGEFITSGVDSTNNVGGIFGYNSQFLTATYCYTLFYRIVGPEKLVLVEDYCSESKAGDWSDYDATYTNEHPRGLLNIGTVWISINTNTAFLLGSFNTNFYSEATSAQITINNWTNLFLSIPVNSYDPSGGIFLLIGVKDDNPKISIDFGDNFGQMISNKYGTYSFKVFYGYVLDLTVIPGLITPLITYPPVYVGYNIINFTLKLKYPRINYGLNFNLFKKHKQHKCKDKNTNKCIKNKHK